MQLINSFSSLVYDGFLKKPQIVEALIEYKNHELKTNYQPVEVLGRTIEKTTVLTLRKLLRYGTIKGSTGQFANQDGFISIGKTSTSQIVDQDKGGYYTNRYASMFIGAYPSDNPQIAMLVIITNPKVGVHSGGALASPLYASLLPEVIYRLNIPHDRKVLSYQNQTVSSMPKSIYTYPLNQNDIPNFKNHSLRNALVLLKRYQTLNSNRIITYTITGSGYVQSQTPSPGAQVTKQTHIHLVLK